MTTATMDEHSAFKALVLPVLLFASAISFIAWGAMRIYSEATFEEQVQSHLTVAAHSVNAVAAQHDLDAAINYLHANGLDSGYTSIFYRTEDENLSKWVGGLSAAHALIATAKDPSTAYLALHTALASPGSTSDDLYIPSGITIAGRNRLYFWWMMISLAVLIVTIGFIMANEGWDLNA